MKCPYCGYEWKPRKPNPVSCPRCKRRLDYPVKDVFHDVKKLERGFQRNLYVMALIIKEAEKYGIKPVIVGGAAVEFYTRDWYSTGDIDLAVDRTKKKKLGEIMKKMGFRKVGRMWIREDLNLYIEMPADIRDIDMSKITVVETPAGNAYVVGMEDILFDRIQAAQFWESEADKEQAVRIATLYFDEIDWNYLEKKCKKAGSIKMLEIVKREAENEKSKME